MTKIVQKRLPSAVSLTDVGDANVRNKMMLIAENIRALQEQISVAQRALVELQNMWTVVTDANPAIGRCLTAAKSYADTKAAAAVATAAADATTKADAAQSAAESTAANALSAHENDSTIHTNTAEKATWNAKYTKPTNGIPTKDIEDGAVTTVKIADSNVTTAKIADYNVMKEKLAQDVQTSLEKADSAIQSISIGNYIMFKSWDGTTSGCVYNDASSTATVTITDSTTTGYTPVAITSIICFGTSTNYFRGIRNSFKCTAMTLSSTTATLTIDMIGSITAMDVDVKFTVMYVKN